MASRKTTALVPRGGKLRAPAKPPVPPPGVKYKDIVESYIIFKILKEDKPAEEIRLDGYTAKTDETPSRKVNNYSFSRTFETAPSIGSIDEMASSLAKSFHVDQQQIEKVRNAVKGIPGLGALAELQIKLTDLTYKENVVENGEPQNYLQFGLGFAPPDGWSIGEVTITGFGFKYTHELKPAAPNPPAPNPNPPANS
jgi:hypothetical protein